MVLIRDLNRIRPPANDALAFYSFEEDCGDTARNSSPNKQDAKLMNATRAPGKQAQALLLDGEKSYLQVPNLGLQTAMTIALWINLADYAKDTFSSVLHSDGWN